MKKQLLTILSLLLIVGIGFSQVSVTEDYITIQNDAAGSNPAVKTMGVNGKNGIEFNNGGLRWSMSVWGDNTFKLLKSSGSSFVPFTIKGTTFNDVLVLGEKGIGIGKNVPEAVLHVDHGIGDALNVGIRTGIEFGYLNVQRPSGNTSSISRWKDNETTVVIIDGHDSTYQLTIYGDALASGGVWTDSDKRLKSDIKKLDGALEKIINLEAKTYKFRNDDPNYSFLNLPEEKQIGFIAQDVEGVLPEAVKRSTFRDGDGDQAVKHELFTINYSSIIPVLTGAIQEQQKIIEDLRSEVKTLENSHIEIERLKEENRALNERLSKLEDGLNHLLKNGSSSQTHQPGNEGRLKQNFPNPFSGITTIKYFIPESSRSASIIIYSPSGQMLKACDIQEKGNGEIEFKAKDIGPGQYSYSLLIDGVIADIKMMILSW